MGAAGVMTAEPVGVSSIEASVATDSIAKESVAATSLEAGRAAAEPAATEWALAPSEPLDPERQLAALARAGGPLRRVVAALAGRLAQGRGWERLGYARVGDYARERLGLSGRAVYELARVDGKLAGLPALEAALVSGGLPWSKVRLLASVATTEDEARWVAYARRVSVRVLAREVRAVDRGALEAGAGAEVLERLCLRGPASLCFKWQRAREYAARTAGERLSPGSVLELVTAEALSSLALDPAAEEEASEGMSWSEAVGAALGVSADSDSAEEASWTTDERSAASVCTTHGSEEDTAPPSAELPAFLRPLVEGLDAADPFALDARLRRAVRLEQRLDAQLAPLLRQVTASEYAWRLRYQTLGAYARERLGMSPRKARALLQLERVGDVCPELRAAYRDGSLSWVQGQILAPLLLGTEEGDWRRRWVAHAQRVTVRRLEEDVDRALALREVEPPREEDDGAGERQVCAQPRGPGGDLEAGWRLTISAPKPVARLFRAVLCSVRRGLERETGRLPSEAEGFEAMFDHALRSWDVTDPWLRRRMKRECAVFERDGWRCTVPGCSSRRNLHAHHIVFRSAGGGDEPENQTSLCAFHHLRGVHAGTVRVEGMAPRGLRFALGVRAGRAPLARYRAGERVA